MHYTVLGYSQNLLLEQYFDRFFEKLLTIFSNIKFDDTSLKENFFLLSLNKQRDFLIHPDISSLILGVHNKKLQDCHEKLGSELVYLLQGSQDLSAIYSGKKIQGTNIYLSVIDNNPDNSIIAHPDHDTNSSIGWGEKTPEEWNRLFEKTFALLKEVNAEFYHELNYVIKKIVPMKTSRDVHNSCSYKDCIGTLYLGYTVNIEFPEIALLEAIIHESSHNKLNLIMHSEPLIKNNLDLKYYSPYRPDARHIYGVYLGVHAIVPTIYVLLNAIEFGFIKDEGWYRKIILYHIKNKLGFNVIKKYSDTTLIGSQILDEIYSVIQLSDTLIKKSHILSYLDKTEISYGAKEHFFKVKNNYPYLQY